MSSLCAALQFTLCRVAEVHRRIARVQGQNTCEMPSVKCLTSIKCSTDVCTHALCGPCIAMNHPEQGVLQSKSAAVAVPCPCEALCWDQHSCCCPPTMCDPRASAKAQLLTSDCAWMAWRELSSFPASVLQRLPGTLLGWAGSPCLLGPSQSAQDTTGFRHALHIRPEARLALAWDKGALFCLAHGMTPTDQRHLAD